MLWHYAAIAWGCSVAAACSGVHLWLGERAHDHGVSHLSQGSVGSCWAFSACGVLEGAWFLATHNLTSLGPEFLVDCDDKDCGVFGGWPYLALEVRDHYFVCVFPPPPSRVVASVACAWAASQLRLALHECV